MNSLTWEQYVPLAFRTAKQLGVEEQWQHARLGVGGEVGEMLDAYKKAFIYLKPFDKTNLMEEIGDTAWYIALDQQTQGFMYHSYNEPATLDLLELLKQAQHVAAATWHSPPAMQTLLDILIDICHHMDVTLGECLFMNIEKLAKRYGDKYSDVAALNRDLDGERAVLDSVTGKQEG